MSLLVAGLVLFLALHLIPSVPNLRLALVERLGEKPYRGVFGAIALLSLGIIVWGFSRAPLEPLYAPPLWGRHAAFTVVPIALVLFAAANMPTHIRALIRHPMLIGLFLWAPRPPPRQRRGTFSRPSSAASRSSRWWSWRARSRGARVRRPTRRRASPWTRRRWSEG